MYYLGTWTLRARVYQTTESRLKDCLETASSLSLDPKPNPKSRETPNPPKP